MRLLSWNACRGTFERKAALLAGLDADLTVLQEVAAPIGKRPDTLWFGDNPRQGVAVIARAPYTLRRMRELAGAPKYVVPILVEGPRPFLLFAVWTLAARPLRYVRALTTALDRYARRIAAHETVFLGDFNSNAIWDAKDPAEHNHASMVARMQAQGLVSAYHHHRREAHGAESRPTFYLQWKEAKPYHLDYCFLPAAWAARIRSVEVGGYAAWKAHSDHRPLLVDLEDPA